MSTIRTLGDARIHRCLGDRRRDGVDQTWVEGHRNDVFRAEFRTVAAIGGSGPRPALPRGRAARAPPHRQPSSSSLIVGSRGRRERRGKNIREAEHVVDLVRIVRPANVATIASSRTAAASSGVISGSGFAMAKMIGLGDHDTQHVRRQSALDRNTEENVRTLHRVVEPNGPRFRWHERISTGSLPSVRPL